MTELFDQHGFNGVPYNTKNSYVPDFDEEDYSSFYVKKEEPKAAAPSWITAHTGEAEILVDYDEVSSDEEASIPEDAPVEVTPLKVLEEYSEKFFQKRMDRGFEDEKEAHEFMQLFELSPEDYYLQKVKDMTGVVRAYRPRLRLKGGGRRKKSNMKRKKGRPRPHPSNIVRIMPTMSADKVKVKLKYPIDGYNLRSLASTAVSKRWYSNVLWDIDPLIASTSVPGFFEYSTLYSYNRVLSCKLKLILSNLEVFPVNVYIIHSNTDPGTSGINWFEYAQNAFGQTHVLSSSNAQPSKTIVSYCSIKRLVGDRIVLTDQNFVGTSTTNAADNTYVGIGLSGIANLSNGIIVTGFLEFNVEFFDRKNLQTTFSDMTQRVKDHTMIENAKEKGIIPPVEVVKRFNECPPSLQRFPEAVLRFNKTKES